jgi:hypothetical protein
MNTLSITILGFFFGFFFGAGCALAVMYSIYSGGYRRGVLDAMREEQTDRYKRWLPWAEKQLKKQSGEMGKNERARQP